MKSIVTCINILLSLPRLPGFSVGSTEGENPGHSSLENSSSSSLESEWRSSERVTVRPSIEKRNIVINCSCSLCEHTKTYHTKTYHTVLRVRHIRFPLMPTFNCWCFVPSFVRVVSPDWDQAITMIAQSLLRFRTLNRLCVHF